MTRLLSGDPLLAELKKSVKAQAEHLAAFGNLAKMAVVYVGEDPTSRAYAHTKVKMGSDLFTSVELHEFTTQTSANALSKLIRRLNNDDEIDGITIESPLPAHLNELVILETVDCDKDVSGLHPQNMGRLLCGDESLGVAPVIPQACLRLLTQVIDPAGRRVVIIGRGRASARPLMAMLANRGASVTLVDPESSELQSICREAEIIISAAQTPAILKPAMIHEGTIIIDAGLNQHDGLLTGDVDFETMNGKVQAISPVPGGVDRLTSILLFENLVKVAERRRN